MKKGSRKRRRLVRAAAIILVVAAAIPAYKHVSRGLFPKRWGVVETGAIYRSGYLPLWRAESCLEDAGIELVIDLTREDVPCGRDFKPQEAERRAVRALGIEHHRFWLSGDGTGDVGHYVDGLEMLVRARREGRRVLVHCAAGTQRTGGLVVLYRTLFQGWSAEEAVRELESYDWDPVKDRVLLDYLNRSMEEIARELARRQLLPRVPDPLPVLRPPL